MICHQCLDKSIANWSSLDVCSCSCPHLSREQGGCLSLSQSLSLSTTLSLMQDSRESSWVRSMVADCS